MLAESGQISDDDDDHFDFDAHVVYEDHVDDSFMNMMLNGVKRACFLTKPVLKAFLAVGNGPLSLTAHIKGGIY